MSLTSCMLDRRIRPLTLFLIGVVQKMIEEDYAVLPKEETICLNRPRELCMTTWLSELQCSLQLPKKPRWMSLDPLDLARSTTHAVRWLIWYCWKLMFPMHGEDALAVIGVSADGRLAARCLDLEVICT